MAVLYFLLAIRLVWRTVVLAACPPFEVPARLHEGTQDRVDTRLVAFPLCLKPFKYITIDADVEVLFWGRQLQRDPILPIFGGTDLLPRRPAVQLLPAVWHRRASNRSGSRCAQVFA
jgi:hypothetical protein